jgi:molybdopterin-guanine dinucleotide biosynthesis protein A
MSPTALIFTNFPSIGGVHRGLYRVLDKPLIEYVLEAVPDEVDEIVIMVGSEEAREAYMATAEKYMARSVFSPYGLADTLKMSMSESSSEQFLVLPCDSPLLTQEFTKFLLDACKRFSAAIIRNSDGRSDYSFSCFRKAEFLAAAESSGANSMDQIVPKIRNVIYFYNRSLKFLDQKLLMLFRVTNVSDARRAEQFLKARGRGQGRKSMNL